MHALIPKRSLAAAIATGATPPPIHPKEFMTPTAEARRSGRTTS